MPDNKGNVGALTTVSTQSILAAYEQGLDIPEQAKQYGVSHQAIYRHLLTKEPEAWKEYQAARALAELEEWDRAVKSAEDALALARAREGLRSAQWKLERLMRRLYGDDRGQQQGLEGRITINIGVSRTGNLNVQAEDAQVLDAKLLNDNEESG